jgi:hypothetical protein
MVRLPLRPGRRGREEGKVATVGLERPGRRRGAAWDGQHAGSVGGPWKCRAEDGVVRRPRKREGSLQGKAKDGEIRAVKEESRLEGVDVEHSNAL